MGDSGVATDLSLFLSEDGSDILAFLGVALLERIRCCPQQLQYKMLIGRMVNAGHRLSELRRQFGHDARTMKQWAAALQSDDPEFIVRVFSGRSRGRKMTPAAARYAARRYRGLLLRGETSYREKIRCELSDYFGIEVCGEVLRRIFRDADRTAAECPAACAPHIEDRSTGCVSAGDSGTEDAAARNESPHPQVCLVPPVLSDPPAQRQALHHAGAILFAVLLDMFLLRHRNAPGWYRQWIGQILQGAVNIEQCREISAPDLSEFVGRVKAGTDCQRAALKQMAGLEETLDIYRANLALLSDGPDRNDVFYYDPHAKEYTGQLNVLKGWCGRRHNVAKAIYLDAIHTESGRCCFIQHYCPFYDLRERFFMTLELFDRLVPEDRRSGRTFVLDRGIYGMDALARFEQTGDHVLTWLKGYGKSAWRENAPTTAFVEHRPRNRADDLRTYRFECQEQSWAKRPGIRLIIVRATNPEGRTIEVAILCSNPHMALKRAVRLMFNRWLQENDFKYLDKHFGINQLTGYASSTYAQRTAEFRDRTVEAPGYRRLARELAECERTLGRLLVSQRRCLKKQTEAQAAIDLIEAKLQLIKAAKTDTKRSKELKEKRTRHRQVLSRSGKRAKKLAEQIAQSEATAAELSRQQAGTLRDASRLELLIAENLESLDTRAKALFDAVRITCSNMFAALVARFRPLYNNYRDDHCWLRMLTRSDGFVQCIDGILQVELWLKGRYQKKQWNTFKRFLAEVSETINDHYAGHAAPVRITLCTRPNQH